MYVKSLFDTSHSLRLPFAFSKHTKDLQHHLTAASSFTQPPAASGKVSGGLPDAAYRWETFMWRRSNPAHYQL